VRPWCRCRTPSARGCSTRRAAAPIGSAWRPTASPAHWKPPARRSPSWPWATARPGARSRPRGGSPGWFDEAAEPFDDAVAAALAAGDAAALAALDPAEGERLLAGGVPTWRAVGAALAGREVTARLRCHEAPYGVGYLVADWAVR
jgi:hypothetical protein